MRAIFIRLSVLLLSSLPLAVNAQWQELGTSTAGFMGENGNFAMAVDAPGNVYVSGYYTNIGNRYYVSKWDGTSWSTVGNINADNSIRTLTLDAAGNLYAAGKFKNPGLNNYYVSKWDGASWKEIRNDSSYLKANYFINTVAVDAARNVYTAGFFSDGANWGKGRPYVAKWDGAKWAPLGTIDSLRNPVGNVIHSIAIDPARNVYAVGSFVDASGNACVMKWNGSSWQVLGALPHPSPGGVLQTIVADKLGNIYASGTIVNNAGTLYVAKWNGSTWTELASPASSLGVKYDRVILALAVTPNGSDVYAAGYTEKPGTFKAYVAHWDGKTWSELGPPPNELHTGRPGGVWELALDGAGRVYATGEFLNPSNLCYVARYTRLPASVPIAGDDEDIQVYPVPNNGRFNVTGPWAKSNNGQQVAVRVSNMLGQVVYAAAMQPSGGTLSVDVRAAASIAGGVYQLQVISGARIYSKAICIGGGE